MTAVTVRAQVSQVGERAVKRVLREVVIVEGATELGERLLQVQLAVACTLDGLRFRVRRRNNHADAWENQDLLGLATRGNRARLDIAIEGLCFFERFLT